MTLREERRKQGREGKHLGGVLQIIPTHKQILCLPTKLGSTRGKDNFIGFLIHYFPRKFMFVFQSTLKNEVIIRSATSFIVFK